MKHYGLVLAVGLLFASVLPLPVSGQEDRPTQPSDSAVDVIHLKISSAEATACVLDEVFNGSGKARKARIVVFAIPMTNCLVIQATSADLLAIRALLRET
jgi:hypothetical protein